MSEVRARLAHRPQEAWLVLRRGEPGLAGPGRPRGDQVVVEDLGRPEDRDALTVHRPPVRRIRLPVVAADADDREPVPLRRGERVAEPRHAEVHAVVVGHGSDVDRPAPKRGERGRGRAEGERLRGRRRRPFVTAVSRLTTARSARSQHGRDRLEHAGRRGRELRLEDALEVDVPAEGEDDRLAAPELPARGRRVRAASAPRTPARRRPRRGRRAAQTPAASSATTVTESVRDARHGRADRGRSGPVAR